MALPPRQGESPDEGVGAREASASASEAWADFDALYAAHFAFVWRSLRRLGVPAASLDDAAQNVFLVVHRRFGEFEGRASPRTWLFRIALRVASDVRRSARRRGGPPVELPESLADAAPDPQQSAERAEAAAVLERLLDELDDEKRVVFVMADLEQMTAPEIAETLGINVNTVGSRLRAARQAFERAVARHQRSAR